MASSARASTGGSCVTSCRVVARFRPATSREAGGARCVSFDAAQGAQVAVSAGGEAVPFAFDAVLGEGASQEDVYDTVARATVDRVQQGFNGAILAYGQSGSGKTYTMGSAPAGAAQKGIIPRIAAQLLADGADVLTLSLVEVYKERIRCAASLRAARAALSWRQSSIGRCYTGAPLPPMLTRGAQRPAVPLARQPAAARGPAGHVRGQRDRGARADAARCHETLRCVAPRGPNLRPLTRRFAWRLRLRCCTGSARLCRTAP
jgi:hypothetical protein